MIAGLLLAIGLAFPVVAQAAAPGSSRLADLQAEQEAIRAESEQLGGSRSPATAENNVGTRINELQGNLDRLHRVSEQLGATAQELDALRQEVGDAPLFDLGDAAQQGGQQAAQQVITRTCTKAVTSTAGWVFRIGDVIEIGGKIIIRELNEDAIRDMVRAERVKLHEIYDLISRLYCQMGQERAALRRVKELRARDNALFDEIAEERERNRPARSRAVLTRDPDRAGDEDERRRALDDAVRPANNTPVPPRPQGVRTATTTQASANPSGFATTILAAHNRERAAVGAMPLAWDEGMATLAGEWAGHLAEIGRLDHSPREGRGTARENIAMGPAGAAWDSALDLWLAEESDFMPGEFPEISRTWNTDGVLHYSQMIWFGTVAIGCGKAEGHGSAWFVCRYSPGGNRPGDWVGARVGEAAQAARGEPVPTTIYFDFNSDQLTEAAYATLNVAIEGYKRTGRANIEFRGTTPEGTDQNLYLGRLEVIHDYLVAHGVPGNAFSSGAISITGNAEPFLPPLASPTPPSPLPPPPPPPPPPP